MANVIEKINFKLNYIKFEFKSKYSMRLLTSILNVTIELTQTPNYNIYSLIPLAKRALRISNNPEFTSDLATVESDDV